jgi:hypothetical protein
VRTLRNEIGIDYISTTAGGMRSQMNQEKLLSTGWFRFAHVEK